MHNKMNKKFSQNLYVIFLMASLIMFASPAIAKQIEAGKVLMATVGVTAQQPGAKARSMARRSSIYVGDTIKTPEGGRAQLRMADGEMLSLTASSELKIEAFQYQPESADTKSSNIKSLVTGGLRTITGAVKGDDYEMKSRAGNIGIRGTAFEVYSQQGENLFVNIQRGNVYVRNAQGTVDIGVDQALTAARIMGINQMPEAISVSDLPQFFEDAFAQDTTLSLAGSDKKDQANNQESKSFEKPARPLGIMQVAQALVKTDIENLEQGISNNSDTPSTPDQNGYFGFVIGEDENYVPLTGKFNNIQKNSSGGFLGRSGTAVLGFNRVSEFNFINGNKDFTSSDYEYYDKLMNDGFGYWDAYSLGDAEIVFGNHICSNCVNNNVDNEYPNFYQYVLSSHVHDNLSSLPTSERFNYKLLHGASMNGSLEGGELNVDFQSSNIEVNLVNYSDSWAGQGTISDFYNNKINLNSSSQEQGEIMGRFVGTNVDGAITAYKLGTEEVGIAVFSRNGDEHWEAPPQAGF